MHDGTSPQVKHIFSDATVAGTAALPTSHGRQGMCDGHALPPCGTPLRGLLAFPPFLQQGFIGMHADTATRRARGTALAQRTARTGGGWTLHPLPGHTGHDRTPWTAQLVALPIQREGALRKIWPLTYGPGLTDNGQRLTPLLDQLTGQVGPVTMQRPPRALVRRHVH